MGQAREPESIEKSCRAKFRVVLKSQRKEEGSRNVAKVFRELEAAIGIEPMDKGFADLCLTTWLRRLVKEELHIPKNEALCSHIHRASVKRSGGISTAGEFAVDTFGWFHYSDSRR